MATKSLPVFPGEACVLYFPFSITSPSLTPADPALSARLRHGSGHPATAPSPNPGRQEHPPRSIQIGPPPGAGCAGSGFPPALRPLQLPPAPL